MDRIVSNTLSNLRFPLAVMVVYIHYFGSSVCDLSDVSFSCFSENDIFNIVRVGFSKNICQIAVPTFFLISGYLFFQKLDEWNWIVWKEKLRRRVNTLIIPYLAWNLIRYFFNAITTGYHVYRSKGAYTGWQWLSDHTTLLIFWATPNSSMPLHVPFWFIRDLIVMIFLSPIFYIILRKRILGLIILIILVYYYVLCLWPSIPGLSIEALLFFASGGFLALHAETIAPPITKFILINRWLPYIAFSIFVVLGVVAYPNALLYTRILHIEIMFGCMSVLLLFYVISKRIVIKSEKLSESSFFVYAFHMFLLIALSLFEEKLSIHVENYPWIRIAAYLFVPILIALLCVAIFAGLKRYTPSFCKILTGK